MKRDELETKMRSIKTNISEACNCLSGTEACHKYLELAKGTKNEIINEFDRLNVKIERLKPKYPNPWCEACREPHDNCTDCEISLDETCRMITKYNRMYKEIDQYAKWKTTDCDMSKYSLTDLFICKIDDSGMWIYTPAYYIDGNFVRLSDGEAINPDYFKLLTRG